MILGTIGIVLATIVTGLLVDRRWSLLPRTDELLAAGKPRPLLPGHGAGESAGTAIAASPGDLLTLRRKQRCPRCKAEMTATADDRATYDHQDLLVLTFACPRCQTVKNIYIMETER
jgi:phage FluMu protein Com